MKTKDRDINSFIVIIDSFIDLANLNIQEKEIIKKELRTYITVRFNKNKWVHPEITKFCTDWYREFYRLVEGIDPYKDLKEKSNDKAKEIVGLLKLKNFKTCLAAGILGNQIDYGACLIGNYDLEKMEKDFENIENCQIHIDDTSILQEKISKAKKVLFLADNNGEIIFDRLLLKKIGNIVCKENIYIFGKETPMLNDVTVADLKELGFDKYGHIVSTGSNCLGLHYEDVSDECKKHFVEVDINSEYDLNIIHLYNHKNETIHNYKIFNSKDILIADMEGNLKPKKSIPTIGKAKDWIAGQGSK